MVVPTVFKPPSEVSIYFERTCEKKSQLVTKSFLVVLFNNQITCRVLKTHRPWYTYQLTPYQVIEPEVPYLWRKNLII